MVIYSCRIAVAKYANSNEICYYDGRANVSFLEERVNGSIPSAAFSFAKYFIFSLSHVRLWLGDSGVGKRRWSFCLSEKCPFPFDQRYLLVETLFIIPETTKAFFKIFCNLTVHGYCGQFFNAILVGLTANASFVAEAKLLPVSGGYLKIVP